MSGICDLPDRDGRGRIARSLRLAASGKVSGTLRVDGRPGGVLQVSDGLVVTAESPGAPGVQAVLVRTGRVGDEAWAEHGGLAAGGHPPGQVGAAHLLVIRLMASQDALFAILLGSIDRCALEAGGTAPLLAGQRGEDPDELLRGALRKVDALNALPRPISPYRERLTARPGTGAPALSGVRQSIVHHANGRRTARDIAVLTGRSLYVVTMEMSRMLGEGLLHEPAQPAQAAGAGAVPVSPRTPLAGDHAPPARPDLPRREPGASGASPGSGRKKSTSSWRDLLRLGRLGETRT